MPDTKNVTESAAHVEHHAATARAMCATTRRRYILRAAKASGLSGSDRRRLAWAIDQVQRPRAVAVTAVPMPMVQSQTTSAVRRAPRRRVHVGDDDGDGDADPSEHSPLPATLPRARVFLRAQRAEVRS